LNPKFSKKSKKKLKKKSKKKLKKKPKRKLKKKLRRKLKSQRLQLKSLTTLSNYPKKKTPKA